LPIEAQTVQAIKDDILDLNSLWHETIDESERAEIRAKMQHLRTVELPEAKQALHGCLAANHLTPLDATFTGTYNVITTHADANGPFEGDITIGCNFTAGRTQVSITRFDDIITDKFSLGLLGDDTVTVKWIAGGRGIKEAFSTQCPSPLS
jgi:hypothetical protein